MLWMAAEFNFNVGMPDDMPDEISNHDDDDANEEDVAFQSQLETDRPIQANLDKMVIYEEGAMYEAQTE
ncbi:hypothetical protein NW757_006553 [Fusarium falciforme]|nr:hypothetical protein NW757_006553 [Fusarium falciforme]